MLNGLGTALLVSWQACLNKSTLLGIPAQALLPMPTALTRAPSLATVRRRTELNYSIVDELNGRDSSGYAFRISSGRWERARTQVFRETDPGTRPPRSFC